MSLRLRCQSCQAAFVTSADQAGQAVACPKCGAEQVATAPTAGPADPPPLARMKGPAAPSTPAARSSVFVPKEKGEKKRSWVRISFALILVVLVGGVAIVSRSPSRPRGPVEEAANAYLQALKDGDAAAAARIGAVEEPPAIRSFRDLARDKTRDSQSRGTFAPIAALHRQIEKKYTYDAGSGRFLPKDPLGPAAETLDALHAAKEKNEKEGIYKKMASGDPEEQMQAAIDFGGTFSRLSEGILSPRKLIPSYKMLVRDARPPLADAEKALALDYARHREIWDVLLKRPFPTLKADGPFVFEKAEVTARVMDKLGSSGDPPTTVRLKLVRFRMDAIDTGWRVVSARRVVPGAPDDPQDEDGPDPDAPADPPSSSPGLIPEGTPGR